MLQSISFFRAVALATFVSVSMAGSAQVNSPQQQSRETSVDSTTQADPFLRGRTVSGANSADLLQRAQQQRLALRKKNLAQQQSALAIKPNVASTLMWSQLGPAPITDPAYGYVSGRATAVAVDPTDTTGNTVYIGGAYGGLWRSTNAATPDPRNVVWTPLLDSAPTLAVGAIAVRPDNGKLILVGTGDTDSTTDAYYGLGILRSEDGGGTWTQITDAAPASGSTRISFKGVGFSKIAFSKDNGNLVVAAASISMKSSGLTTCSGCTPGWGLFYSTDAGKTWTAGVFKDGTAPPAGGTGINTVVYNPADKTFYAAVSYHGLYSSTDGANWTRLANQPLGAAMDATACPSSGSVNCPIYRAGLAVRPGSNNELYVWIATAPGVDEGIFVSKDSGATWTALDETGITNCGDATGCGVQAGNMQLAAVPIGDGTDLYAGSANIYKCSINAQNPTCTNAPFLNLTHVYGCSPTAAPAHVNPGQQGIDFSTSNTNLIYFANDGGIYRSINATGLNSSSCSASNPFGNLNGTMGSMAQFVSFAETASDPTILLGGTATNGSISTNNSTFVDKGTDGLGWSVYAPGFGVFNAAETALINPDNANEWFVSAPASTSTSRQAVSISRCTQGVACAGSFTRVIDPSTYGDDSTAYPAPFILDPQATNQMILGTCRVWRGSSNPTAPWAGPISPNFTTNDSTTCLAGTHRMLTAVAAGGPKVDGVGSQVIYAGDELGHVYVTANANGAPAAWTDTTPLTQTAPSWGYFPISSIVVDSSDATGATAYLTVQGFNNGAGHVFKTTNMGATWTNISGDPTKTGIPDAPADSIAIDPSSPGTVYVGTDVGVYVTSDNGANWAEYGPTTGAGVLPNVPVTKLDAIDNGTVHKLRASTYGRGMWDIDLASYSDFTQTVSPTTAKVHLGATIIYQVTYAPLGAFSGDVAVTCTGPAGSALPNGFTCTVAPQTVTTGTTAQVTVVTDPTKVSVGTYTIEITGTSGNLEPKVTDVTLQLTDFAVVIPKNASGQDQNSVTVTAGNSATYPITVTTDSGFTDSVTLSCTSTLPDKTSCSFSPSVIVPGGNSVLTITTTAATTAQLTAPAPFNHRPVFAFWFGLPGIVVAGAGVSGRRRKVAIVLALLVIIASVIGFVACGGSKSSTSTPVAGTPAGTYTITVTGTAGTLTHTNTVTLVVN
jgi:hypothetical protein